MEKVGALLDAGALEACRDVHNIAHAQHEVISATLSQATRVAEASLAECVPKGWFEWIGNLDEQVETKVLGNEHANKIVGRSRVACVLAAHLRELPDVAASVALAARLAKATSDASNFVGAYAVVNILLRRAKDFAGNPDGLLRYIQDRRSTLSKKGVVLPKPLADKLTALEVSVSVSARPR